MNNKTKFFSAIRSRSLEYVIVTLLFGGLLYAAKTAYQTSVENSLLKENLQEQQEDLTAIRKSLYFVMRKLELPDDVIAPIIGQYDGDTLQKWQLNYAQYEDEIFEREFAVEGQIIEERASNGGEGSRHEVGNEHPTDQSGATDA